jgi:hypothetical protein
LKNTKHALQTEVNEVCGSAFHAKFHYSWLLPVPVSFKDPELCDRVYGFRSEEGEEMSPLLAVAGSTPVTASRIRKTLHAATDSRSSKVFHPLVSYTVLEMLPLLCS